MSTLTMPGISVPGKLLVAQISKALGTLSQIIPSLSQSGPPSVHLRIVFYDHAAFWAFAYLVVKPSFPTTSRTILVNADHQQHIVTMLDFFQGDEGTEFSLGTAGALGGEGALEGENAKSVDVNPPPGYTGLYGTE
ncbi:hypothetical protein B0H10DRAFT_1958487 [Mycena sp. CBHHK59/15]|nr:hypothetical protein B0H10DRAFT_1958487 [Mycena sp. CBHHK59/15]